MTTRKGHGRRARRGWMSSMKDSSGRRRKTPLWQWLVGVPLVALVAIVILTYLYLTYINPKLGVGAHWVKGEVVERTEKKRPDGTIDPAASSILVRVEGKEVRLAPQFPAFNRITKGDIVEVEISTSAGGIQTYSWRLPAAPPAPLAPAGRPASSDAPTPPPS